MPDGVQKLQAALDEKVKNKLIPDTEMTVKIEPQAGPPFVASDRRPRAREARDRRSTPRSTARSISPR